MRTALVVSLLLFGTAARADTVAVDRDRVTSALADAVSELARVETTVDRCADVRANLAEIRGRLSALRAELERAGGPGPLRPPPQDPPPDGGPTAIDDRTFEQLAKRISGEAFSSGKLRVIREAAASNYFRAGQVARLLGGITMGADKLKALESLAPHLVDPERAFVVYKVFDFDADKAKAEKILKSTR